MPLNSIQKVDPVVLKSNVSAVCQEVLRTKARLEAFAGYLNKFQSLADATDFGLTNAEASLINGCRISLNNVVAAIELEKSTLDNLRPPLVI